MPPSPIVNNTLLMPNCVATRPTSDRYNDLYSSDSDNDTVFKETFSNFKTANSINPYSVLTQRLILSSTSTKVIKKQRKIIGRTKLATIKRAQSNTAASF